MIDENLFVSKQFFMHLLFVSTKTVGFTEIKAKLPKVWNTSMGLHCF